MKLKILLKFKISLLLINSLLISIPLFAYNSLTPDQISEIAHSTKRSVVSLQGKWERSIDNGIFETVYVPSTDFDTRKVTYKKEFKISKDFIENKNAHLLFMGLGGQAEIYVNSEFLTKIDGKLLPYDISIPNRILIDGNNEVKLVFLENSALERLSSVSSINAPKIPKGIIREPFIVGTSQIYINELKYRLKNLKKNTNAENNSSIEIDITCVAGQISKQILEKNEATGAVSSKRQRVTAECQIINKRTNIAVSALDAKDFNIEISRTANLKFNISTAAMKEWSINSPELYKIVVKLKVNGIIIDEYCQNIGLKSLTTKNNKFYLNDSLIELKAITYYEYHGTSKNTLSTYRLEEDIKNIKLIGANAIRVQFLAPNPYLVYLCEKYGLLLLIDLPMNNLNNALLQNAEYIAQIKNNLSLAMQYYSNSSSFVGIGIGNCVIEGENYVKLEKQLMTIISNYKKLVYKTIDIGTENFAIDALDFICLNSNDSHKDNNSIAYEIDKVTAKCNMPIVLSFSSRVKPGNLNGYSDKTSNEFQAYFIKNCYNLSLQKKLAGVLINSYNDYKTNYPVLSLNYFDQYINTDGITDIYHSNRTSVNTLKALLNDERLPLLNAGQYETELPISYIIIGLITLLILIYMNNKYNRFREYFARAFFRPYNFFADIRDHRILSIMQTLILGCLLAISVALCFGSLIFNLRAEINYSYLFTAIFPFDAPLKIIFNFAWKPELLLAFFAVIVIIHLLINALLIKLLAIIMRARLFLDYTINMAVWSALPLIILLPIGIVLAKLILVSPVFITIVGILFIVLSLWCIYRLFNAIAIVFDKPSIQVYSIGLVFLIVTMIIPAIYYEGIFNISAMFSYFMFLN
jgi:beta-galactosidase